MTDSPGAARQGVMLDMAVVQNRIAFEANLQAARAAGLNLGADTAKALPGDEKRCRDAGMDGFPAAAKAWSGNVSRPILSGAARPFVRAAAIRLLCHDTGARAVLPLAGLFDRLPSA